VIRVSSKITRNDSCAVAASPAPTSSLTSRANRFCSDNVSRARRFPKSKAAASCTAFRRSNAVDFLQFCSAAATHRRAVNRILSTARARLRSRWHPGLPAQQDRDNSGSDKADRRGKRVFPGPLFSGISRILSCDIRTKVRLSSAATSDAKLIEHFAQCIRARRAVRVRICRDSI